MEKVFNFNRYSLLGDLSDVEYCNPPVVVIDKVVDRNSNVDALLAEIFAIDPLTNLPTGDLSQYLGADTHPQIKAYIQNELLQSIGTPQGASSELSDDDLVRYSRHTGESVRDYVDRMSCYIRDDCEKRIYNSASKRVVSDTKDE